MKLSWGKQKLTVVIIPENAHAPVVQWRLRHAVFYVAGALTLAIVLWSCILTVMHAKDEDANQTLQQELDGSEERYDQALATKEQTIQQLQSQVIALSQQAEEVKQKMEEVKKLENDLRSLTSSVLTGGLASAAHAEPETAANTGRGGAFIAVTNPEIAALSEQTAANFEGLKLQAGDLQASLALFRQKVLEKQYVLRLTPTIWPVGSRSISSPYGYRPDPLTRVPSFHSGVDIAEKEGTPVKVTAEGRVITTDYDNSRGNYVVVDHTGGLHTIYMHLSKILVKPGDRLSKGDPLGLVGSTGRSTGPHVHYEVQKNGQTVDPMPYLKGR